MHQVPPTVGQWYLRPDTGRKFEVIDIDDGDGMIEIQDQEGTLDQIDSDAWFTDSLEATDQPQDFSGALDNTPEPDEADGGDPVSINAPDTDPLRVAQDEMLNDAQNAADSDSDDDLETDVDTEAEEQEFATQASLEDRDEDTDVPLQRGRLS